MRINVTDFFHGCDPMDYSASAHEIGQDAGTITWQNALRDSAKYALLDGPEALTAMEDYLRATGGWTVTDCDALSVLELNALCLQFVSSDMREGKLDAYVPSWDAYYDLASEGAIQGRLSCDDTGAVFYDLGN